MILFAGCAAMAAGCLDAAPATDVAEDELATSTSELLAPMCGDGELQYKAWVCHWGTTGWTLDVVGGRDYLCTAPYTSALWGTTTGCWTKERIKCGGGAEDANGDGVPDCNASSLSCPSEPSTFCYRAPPPMTTPGNPPPGGANGG